MDSYLTVIDCKTINDKSTALSASWILQIIYCFVIPGCEIQNNILELRPLLQLPGSAAAS
jgi:hypothetical protein